MITSRASGTSSNRDLVTSIYQDGSGIFWISTFGGGLNRWHRDRDDLRHFRVRDGLPSDDVVGVVEDDRMRLWLATNRGLACLDTRSGEFRE